MAEATQKEQNKEVGESKWPLYLTGAIVVVLVLAYFVSPDFKNTMQEAWLVMTSGEEEQISEWVSQFGFWGPFFLVGAMVAQMFLVVVNVVALMLVAILAYGPVWGSALAVLAVSVAATVGYFIGHALGETGVSKIIGHKAEKKVAGFVDDYGIWAVIIARISPLLSNDAVSFVAGFAKMGYLKFMAATLAGIIPLTILLAWLGENSDRLKSGLLWLGGISLLLFIGYVVYDKYVKKS
ncbi:TVP38/TMEM64 family protein [Pontibacter qinzhouensis]|uniref:TVP38/TMEM64 family membrane protein n=1 Tax=Pontibacter qinzhouensis TaxID=2603253 RepID=A0A5C8KBT8_9BACT|nr:TVP38/TMEM64 family protein [Pontibacter qinzhouensis]TXK51898.1 TVP38/TMEM64 family protein [Pontibacter qinzhouensis]